MASRFCGERPRRRTSSPVGAGTSNAFSNADAPRYTPAREAFADEGAIISEHPRRAAQHFVALTFQLALDSLDPAITGAWDAVG
jgi:TetR/AcrR family transcriptional repressor of mexJK operon